MFVSCVEQVYGGMRGMKGLVYETSVLDPDEVSTHLEHFLTGTSPFNQVA